MFEKEKYDIERIRAGKDRGSNGKPNGRGRAETVIPTSAHSMETLKTMTFEPIKYVVPGVIVEGLTILAGKPKLGKSWLLLHAAIAVASGGFTLGDIHCPEGDLLRSRRQSTTPTIAHDEASRYFAALAEAHAILLFGGNAAPQRGRARFNPSTD